LNLDSLRALCLSFPHATENVQWGGELCFKVKGKIFAMVSLDSVPQSLIFKCDPEKFAELNEREGVSPAPYVGRYKWVMLEGLDVLPDRELQDLIRQSYAQVAAKIPAARATRSRQKYVRKPKPA
jgi:predicted DNA-binding protein (MmcQ/YjbR family)